VVPRIAIFSHQKNYPTHTLETSVSSIVFSKKKRTRLYMSRQGGKDVHPLRPFEHGLLHVHVRVLRHAHLLLSFLVP
jgi:hypothetical protein